MHALAAPEAPTADALTLSGFDSSGKRLRTGLASHHAQIPYLARFPCAAIRFAELAEVAQAATLFGWAKTLLQRARDLSPDDDSYLLYLSGYCEYMDSDGEIEDALEWFSRACACDSPDAWACLYRAHCLHDLERWAEAVSAYEAVDLSAFKGPTTWRGEKLREQLGACRLRTGDVVGALADFEAVLKIYEQLPCDRIVDISDLVEAAGGVFREELAGRVAVLIKRLGLDGGIGLEEYVQRFGNQD